MDFLRNMNARVAFIIYAATAATLALFWLVIPEYSFEFWRHSKWFNGYQAIELLSGLNKGFLAFLLFGNFILPGVALLMSWLKKELDWLWSSIAFGYAFTSGVVVACCDGLGLTIFWYLMFLVGSAWCVFAFFRRGIPTHL